MPILSTPSGAFPISLAYITVGTLIDIWTIVAWFYYPPESPWGRFLVIGFMVTGFALLMIGVFLGHIGRAARNAELPPEELTPAVAQTAKTAAAHPQPVVAAPAVGQPNEVTTTVPTNDSSVPTATTTPQR
jgi:hypothetical protein